MQREVVCQGHTAVMAGPKFTPWASARAWGLDPSPLCSRLGKTLELMRNYYIIIKHHMP